jgi:hypothetical protein
MAAAGRAIVLWLATCVGAPHGERGSILSARGLGRARAAALPCTALLAIAAVGPAGAGATSTRASSQPSAAKAARTVALSESGRLRLTSKRGFTLNERGTASGTIAGTIYIHLHLVSDSRVTAEVNIYPRGGSLTGTGSASYRVVGGYAVFTGTLAIVRGSGRYAHARASGLRFTGTIQRRDDAVAVHLSGRLSY